MNLVRCICAAAFAVLAGCGCFDERSAAWGQVGIPIGGGSSTPSSSGVAAAGAPTGYINVTNAAYGGGAKGNTLSYADGTITSGTNAFSSASATFTAADVGKSIVVDYAGAAGAPLVTTIAGFTSANAVTLTANASTTVPYIFTWACVPTTEQSGAGSYAPGDTIVLAGGTNTTPTTCTVRYTNVFAAVQNANGSGGVTSTGSPSGACQVQGTTGAGASKFILNVTLTSGAISAIGSFVSAGGYTTNPTSLTAEPVVPYGTCTGLTGATLTLTMGVYLAQPTTAGVYSVYPSSPVAQASTSGSGTGATFSPQTVTGGAFMYATDDTTALTAAFNAAIAQLSSGGPQCVFFPEGAYFISSPLPTFYSSGGVPGCVIGSGQKKTWLMVSPALNGDLLSWSEAWVAGNSGKGGTVSGGIGGYTAQAAGPILKDISLVADRTTANNQNAVVFYDRNDQIEMSNVDMFSFNGYCLASGVTKNTIAAYVRESNFNLVRPFYCGNSTHPAVLFDSQNSPGDATNEVNLSQFNIFAFFGHGLQIRSNGTPVRDIRMSKIRIEGIQFYPVTIAADNMVIGDSTATSLVDSIFCDQCELLSVQPGRSALRLDANGGANAPYFIGFKGFIGGELMGQGLTINYGRGSEFYFYGIGTLGPNVTLASTAGTGIMVTGPAKAEDAFTYNVSGGQLATYPVIFGTPGSNSQYLSAFLPGVSAALGNTPGAGAVNLGLDNQNAYNVASGANSVRLGGINSLAAGTGTAVVSGFNVGLTGNWSGSIGGIVTTDRGWIGARCHASGSLTDFSGDANFCEQVLRCQATATNGSTCRATADNLAAGAANVANIPNAAAYAVNIKCAAIDRATVGNNFSWSMNDGLLTRGANAASTAFTAGTTVTHSNGTVTGIGVAATADTTQGGLNLTFTSPSTNSDLYDFSCQVQTQQTQ